MLNMPVADIKKKIQEQTELSAEDVDKKIQQKMAQLSGLISEEGACHIVANELSVKLLPDAENRKVKDLLPGMREVTQDMRVVQVYELRTFQSKFGGEGKVASFLGGDESGVIRVTAWGEKADEAAKLEPGTIVRVHNGYIKDNQGRAELHMNNNSDLELSPKGVNIESTGGSAQSSEPREYVRKKISELSQGDYRVELLGTIVQVYDPRVFDRKDGSQGIVVNMLLDDGTGSVRCSCWDEKAGLLLGKTVDEIKSMDSFDEEKTAALGHIVKVAGRAKLNTVYNNIELSADTLELNPDAKEDMEKLGAVAQSAAPTSPSAVPSEQSAAEPAQPIEPVAEPAAPEPTSAPAETPSPQPAAPSEQSTDAPSKPDAGDAVSLDDLEDMDVGDIDLEEFDDL